MIFDPDAMRRPGRKELVHDLPGGIGRFQAYPNGSWPPSSTGGPSPRQPARRRPAGRGHLTLATLPSTSEDYGVDQVCFRLPGDATSYEEAIELIETFGRHVFPEFDKDPVVSTDRYRALAQPKFPSFSRPPLEIPTLHSPA